MPSRERSPLRVVLGDDHAAMRRGVRAVLENAGFEVVAEARDAAGTVEAALRAHPDVCLLDVRMPGDGIAAAAEIARAVPGTHVVMLSVSLEEADLFAALRAGASGYLLKDMDPQRLPFAIRGVLEGEAALPRTLTAQLIEEYRGRSRRTALPTSGDPLTEREAEVLDLLADGRPPAELARRLGISPVTVRRHVSAIVRKLQAADRDDAVRIAREARGGG